MGKRVDFSARTVITGRKGSEAVSEDGEWSSSAILSSFALYKASKWKAENVAGSPPHSYDLHSGQKRVPVFVSLKGRALRYVLHHVCKRPAVPVFSSSFLPCPATGVLQSAFFSRLTTYAPLYT